MIKLHKFGGGGVENVSLKSRPCGLTYNFIKIEFMIETV